MWFYLWIHVKIYFDQLSKAGKRVQVSPVKQSVPNGGPAPIYVTVLAPYPHYEKNHSVYDGGNYGPKTKNVRELIEILSQKPETPMLDQETPKNNFFILQDFWPVFKVFQILGLFPCQKETNEKGTIQLKSIGWWISVIKIFGVSTLLILPKAILLGHLISSNKEVSDYFNDFGARLFSKNTARAYVTGFFGPVFFVLQSGLLWAFMIKMKELCALQEIFSAPPLNDTAKKDTKKIREARIYLILIIVLSLTVQVSNLLYVNLPLLKLLKAHALIVLIIVALILECLCGLFFCLMNFNTVILYLQLTCNIMNLAEEIDLDSLKFGTILENTAHLMKKLNMTSSFLSPQCFYMILFWTTMVIVQVFAFIDYSDGISQFSAFTYVSIVTLILLSILILCIFNWQSYDVKQRLSEIRLYIFNFEITETNFVVIDKQKHSEEHSRKIVISMLDEFKGFDANGYFTLGKELLGSIFIQCITFVVILIEFRK